MNIMNVIIVYFIADIDSILLSLKLSTLFLPFLLTFKNRILQTLKYYKIDFVGIHEN